MLTAHFVPLIERISGQKWIAQVASYEGAPTERTLRNWESGATVPSERQKTQLRKAGEDALRRKLIGKGMPDEKASAHADDIVGEPGLMSAVVRGLSVDAGIYSSTLDLARQVDRLSNDLVQMRQAEQLADVRRTLLEYPWFTADHWHLTLRGAECPVEMRRLMEQARNWEELDIPFNVLMINVLLQFLATLDLEFCASFAPSYEATPLFARLHPAFPGDASHESDTNTGKKRDPVRRPIRRLIDLMACLRQRKLEGRWPDEVPKVHDTARWMDVDESKLTKWRLGRRFRGSDFTQAWDAMFDGLDPDRRPSTPWPLLITAHLLTILYVKGNRVKQEAQTVIIPDASEYLKWWDRQKSALSSDEKGLRFGTAPWFVPLN